MRFLILFFLVAVIRNAYSYNDAKCTMAMKRSGFFSGGLISTSSFLSSTGDCAAIGSTEQHKQQFIAFNLDELKLDSARGGGEYAEAYAMLSGCSSNANSTFSKALQNNFTQIYGTSADHDAEAVYNSIEQVISRDQMLSKECQVRGS